MAGPTPQVKADPDPRIKLRLFLAPFVDAAGVTRNRVCGFVTGADPENDRQILEQISAALKDCEEQATAIAVGADIDVSWL